MFIMHEKCLDFLNWGTVRSHPTNGSPVCAGTAEVREGLIAQPCKRLRIGMINLSLWCGGTKGLQHLISLAGSQILDKHRPNRPFLSQGIYNLRCSTGIIYAVVENPKGRCSNYILNVENTLGYCKVNFACYGEEFWGDKANGNL